MSQELVKAMNDLYGNVSFGGGGGGGGGGNSTFVLTPKDLSCATKAAVLGSVNAPAGVAYGIICTGKANGTHAIDSMNSFDYWGV